MGASQESRLCSDPSETSTTPCPSAPVCPPPHPLSVGSSWGCDSTGHGTGDQGQTDKVAQRHREQGQGRAWRHLNGNALCQRGSVGFVSGPLAVLRTEHGATTVVTMEPCFLPCRHIEASLIPMPAQG